MSSTELLAIIGAIGSAVAITWNVIRELHDRANLKIEAMIGRIVPHHTDRVNLVITITNIGRRPVVVTKWGGFWKKSVKGKPGFIVIPQGLPKLLKESDYFNEYTDDLSILSPNLKKICVWDSAGREWKISRKNLKRLFKDLKELKLTDKE